MTKRDRAAYMREYRKRRRIAELSETTNRLLAPDRLPSIVIDLGDRLRDCQAEVVRLKQELAGRPAFNSRPFTPVPKKGK